MLVENLVFYDFTDTLERFEFKYLHMSNKEKVLEVKEDKIIIKKLGCDYSLIGYIPKPLENAVSSLVPFGQGEKEIT